MKEFSKPQYFVDVLKVEVPINAEYVEGSSVFKGQKAYYARRSADAFPRSRGDRRQAVHLSERGREQRAVHRIAAHGRGSRHGFLRRALRPRHLERRHPGLRQAGRQGAGGMAAKEGVRNINAVNDAIKSATPWYAKMGMAAV